MIAGEVGAVIVAWVAGRLAVGGLHNSHILDVDQVIIVAVASPHQVHLSTRSWRSHQPDRARISQVLRPFHAPTPGAGYQAGDGDHEVTALVSGGCRVVHLRSAKLEGQGDR